MQARMNDHHATKRPGHRAKRSPLSRLFGHGPAFKTSSPPETPTFQAVAAPAQTSLDTATGAATKCKFVLARSVAFGERIAVVGETNELGCWKPSHGLLLQWSEGDVWSGEVCLQPGVHAFKCVTVKANGHVDWEHGGNRVIKVPADAGGALLARCEWAKTSHTTFTVTPDTDAAHSAAAASASLAEDAVFHSMSDISLWSGDSADDATAVATVSCSPKAAATPTQQQQQQQRATAARAADVVPDYAPAGPVADDPAGPGADDSTSSSCSDVVYMAARGALSTGKQASLSSQQSQLIAHGSYTNLGPAVSSEDLSVYTYNTYTGNSSSSSVSESLSHQTSFTADPQQPLTSASLAAVAAAAAAADGTSGSTDYSVSGSAAGDDPDSLLDAEGPATLQRRPVPMSVSPSPFSGKPPVGNVLSPTSTTSTRPLQVASSSLMSFSAYSSMEVSEANGTDEVGTVVLSSEEGLVEAAAAAATALISNGAAAAVSLEEAAAADIDNAAISELLGDPLAFEQLMAVEPAVLAAQQQQQLLQQQQLEDAPKKQARAADQGQQPGSVFMAAAAAAAATFVRYGNCSGSQEIFSAAGDVCALGDDVDAAALLPQQDTLPPTALSKYATVEAAEPELLLDDDQQLPDQAAEARPGLPEVTGSSFSSCSSSLTKDDLPCLGLTVTVPSLAEKAADAAAQMNAANADAAAAVAAAKPAYGGGEILEAPVAQEGLRLVAAAHMIPHVDKTHTGGEDAYFISPAGHGAMGVSDGVSAWAEDGIDPGEYSRTLVQYCAEAFEERITTAARAANKGSYMAKFDPRAVLRYAQQCTCKPGSATVVLAALQPGGKLHVANLGDCGVKVVRDGKIVFETQPQQHDFNLPYQLSHPRLFPDTDTADSADRYTWDVQEGDVIVAASDGLFDNLWDDELLALLPQGLLGAPPPLDSTCSLTGMDSLGRSAGKKLLRSRSFAALTRSSSTASVQGGSTNAAAAAASGGLAAASSTGCPLPPASAAAAAAAAASIGGSNATMPRSSSTSQLASWSAKQFRSWGRSRGGKAATAMAAAYVLSENGVFADDAATAAAAAAGGAAAKRPASPAEVSAADVTRAAELLAAAAAAHAADKEFKSPWSVAAGKAYGLLARLFAKGGKMDDITCVVAVVQDAAKAKAIAEAAAADTAVSDSSAESSLGMNSDEAASPVSL